jgi:hypothetical protein
MAMMITEVLMENLTGRNMKINPRMRKTLKRRERKARSLKIQKLKMRRMMQVLLTLPMMKARSTRAIP